MGLGLGKGSGAPPASPRGAAHCAALGRQIWLCIWLNPGAKAALSQHTAPTPGRTLESHKARQTLGSAVGLRDAQVHHFSMQLVLLNAFSSLVAKQPCSSIPSHITSCSSSLLPAGLDAPPGGQQRRVGRGAASVPSWSCEEPLLWGRAGLTAGNEIKPAAAGADAGVSR